MRKNHTFRTLTGLMLTVLLSAAFFALFLSAELRMGYFSSGVFDDSLRASGYGTKMEQEMQKKQKELFRSYGLPEALTEEIWEENEAYLAFLEYVNREAEAGEEERADSRTEGGFGQREAIEGYLESENAAETESIREITEALVSESETICRRYVYSSFIRRYYAWVREREAFVNGCMAASAAIAVLCGVLLVCQQKEHRRSVCLIAGGLFPALLWNLVGTLALRLVNLFPASGVKPDFYKEFLEIFRLRGLYAWYVVDIAAAGGFLLLLALGKRMRKQS